MIKKSLAALAFAALLACGSAHAGYAQLAPPAGFGGSPGAFTYAANAANDKTFGKVVQSAGTLTANVGGQTVKMGAAYRLAANAPRIAALAVMQHPAVRIAVGAVGVVAWLASAKLAWDETNKVWREIGDHETTTGKLFKVNHGNLTQWHTSALSACSAYASYLKTVSDPTVSYTVNGATATTCNLTRRDSRYPQEAIKESAGIETKTGEIPGSCPTGWIESDQGCLSPALSQPEFVEKLANTPMPSSVPLELPYPTPLPIEQPSPWINPTPGENPQSQPYRVPTGEPSPIPNTNPQQYKQPYIDIIPAPLPDSPWRVDVKPGELTSTDPNPITDPSPNPDSQENPTDEKDQSLCEKFPDIAACEKIQVEDTPLPSQPKLYQPKYPDGLTGVWNSKVQEIKATPLFSLGSQLMPTVGGGSCPSWTFDLGIDRWVGGGSHDVSPPCWVWDVAKLVIIGSALLLARRLIFGG